MGYDLQCFFSIFKVSDDVERVVWDKTYDIKRQGDPLFFLKNGHTNGMICFRNVCFLDILKTFQDIGKEIGTLNIMLFVWDDQGLHESYNLNNNDINPENHFCLRCH